MTPETETAPAVEADDARDARQECPQCNGTGEVDGATCPECDGTGEVPETDAAAKPEQTTDEPERKGADQPLEWRKKKAATLAKSRERRTLAASNDLELRADADGQLTLTGYACRTGVSYDVGFYRETISPTAFKRTLSEDPDVQLLVNHDGMPLARTKSGTLRLAEDGQGLRVEASLDPEDPDVQSLYRKMQRGDIDQMSFAFQATDQEWNEDYTERTIRCVSIHRGDVSVVNYGASPTTFASIRSHALDVLARYTRQQTVDALIEWRDHTLLPLEARAGKTLSSGTMDVLTQVLNLVAAADEAVDEAQPLLAELMGVPNPDADDDPVEPDGDDGAAARAWTPPDHTTEARQRLAVLQNGRR